MNRTQRPTRDERRAHARALPRPDRVRLTGCVLAAALVAAPFLALLYGLNAALAVMTLALTATAYLARTAAGAADAATRQRLRTAVVINVVLALVCAIVLVMRVV